MDKQSGIRTNNVILGVQNHPSGPEPIQEEVSTSALKGLLTIGSVPLHYYRKHSLTLNVRTFSSEKPVLEKPTTTVAALYVENKELTCSVQVGNPSPTVKWQYQVDTCESTSTDKCEPLNDAWIDVDEVGLVKLFPGANGASN